MSKNGAELFVECLEIQGVDFIFGVPGEENQDFLFALEKSKIKFIPVRHEQGAAFIANVYGRLSGRVGVCLATLGPGATNLFTGVADAFLDKAPLLALTGQGSTERLHHESHQVIDVVAMFRPITKWNTSIHTTASIPEVVHKAIKIAEWEKPGATHIELPENVAGLTLDHDAQPLSRMNVILPTANSASITAAADLLEQAKKPLILAGNGSLRSRASTALIHFCEHHEIPVAHTFMGKGAIPASSLFSIGTVGLGFRDYISEAFEESDLILTVGYDIAEYDPKNWNIGLDKQIVHLDFTTAEVYQEYQPNVEVIGDIEESIALLEKAMEKRERPSWFKDIRSRIQKSIASYAISGEDKVTVPGVVQLVRDIFPDDAIVISDVGAHKMWIARNYDTECPSGCIISNGLASMGIALPGAIGAKMLYPDRHVIAIMGDGAALMNIQELETAKRLQLPITVIIVNDNNYGLIEWKQEREAGHSFGTRIGNPDFAALAQSFGFRGVCTPTAAECADELRKNRDNPQPLVIEAPVDTDFNDQLIKEIEQYFD